MKATLSAETIPDLVTFVADDARRFGFDESLISRIALAIEEVLVNIVYHGREDMGSATEVSCHGDGNSFTIVISDPSPPFDMTAYVDPPHARSIKELPVGGLGIRLVRTIVDEIEYTRESGRNIHRLIVRRSEVSEAAADPTVTGNDAEGGP